MNEAIEKGDIVYREAGKRHLYRVLETWRDPGGRKWIRGEDVNGNQHSFLQDGYLNEAKKVEPLLEWMRDMMDQCAKLRQ